MRLRKPRGRHKARVTLTEAEILEACDRYVRAAGHAPSALCWVKVRRGPARHGDSVQVVFELDAPAVTPKDQP